jgi:hypothetical protein
MVKITGKRERLTFRNPEKYTTILVYNLEEPHAMKTQAMYGIRTATHHFWINCNRYGQGEYIAEFRPLNPKTGEPWQASHRITIGADVSPANWGGRMIAYSTFDRARRAVEEQGLRLARRIKA